MGYRSQPRSSRSGRGHQKTAHQKAKARTRKRKLSQGAIENKHILEAGEVVDKTIGSLRGLGEQKFAVSPFSQYFDDWLVNLRKILSVFESVPDMSVDEAFVKERSQILGEVEGALARRRLEENASEETRRILSEKNHLLVEADADYATEVREIRQKRNAEIEDLTRNVRKLEDQLNEVSKMKTSFFGSFSKKAKAQKQTEIAEKLTLMKKELEMAIQNFAIEQEQIHDTYEKRKQETMEQVQSLEKKIEKTEIDTSQEFRRQASEALVEAVTAFLKRKALK